MLNDYYTQWPRSSCPCCLCCLWTLCTAQSWKGLCFNLHKIPKISRKYHGLPFIFQGGLTRHGKRELFCAKIKLTQQKRVNCHMIGKKLQNLPKHHKDLVTISKKSALLPPPKKKHKITTKHSLKIKVWNFVYILPKQLIF